MFIIFLAIIFLFTVVTVVVGALQKKKYNGVVFNEKEQCKGYYRSIAILWSATLAVFIMCLIGSISFSDIGFRPISFDKNIWFTVITLVLSATLLLYNLHQLIMSLTSGKYRASMNEHITNAEGINQLLPRSKKEKRLFSLVALTAGVCEEIIYRGFLVFLLQATFPGMPIFLIILIPSVLFGLGHFYQGVQGVILTGVLGALLMSLFLVSNSLLFVMILHFIIDFSATFLISEERIK